MEQSDVGSVDIFSRWTNQTWEVGLDTDICGPERIGGRIEFFTGVTRWLYKVLTVDSTAAGYEPYLEEGALVVVLLEELPLLVDLVHVGLKLGVLELPDAALLLRHAAQHLHLLPLLERPEVAREYAPHTQQCQV
eukprot:829433-Prorocentrum_minimum.AAC.1